MSYDLMQVSGEPMPKDWYKELPGTRKGEIHWKCLSGTILIGVRCQKCGKTMTPDDGSRFHFLPGDTFTLRPEDHQCR